MSTLATTALSLAVLAAAALTAGGIGLIVRGGDKKRGALMLGAAAVLAANVLIWAL